MIFNHKLLQNLRKNADKYGLKEATKLLLKELEVPLIIKEGKISTKKPLLIISNHPGVFDSLVLFSQVEREDFYFIALSTYGIFGEKVKEKLLPIFRKRKWNHRIYEYPLVLQIQGKRPERLNASEIRAKNRETISKAATLINEGKVVSIFPTGSAGKSLEGGSWKAGVGFLVKQITNPQTDVIFTKIEGTKKSDLIAYLHPVIRKIFFKPKQISIKFSRPQKLSELVNKKEDGKFITRTLEMLYNNYWK